MRQGGSSSHASGWNHFTRKRPAEHSLSTRGIIIACVKGSHHRMRQAIIAYVKSKAVIIACVKLEAFRTQTARGAFPQHCRGPILTAQVTAVPRLTAQGTAPQCPCPGHLSAPARLPRAPQCPGLTAKGTEVPQPMSRQGTTMPRLHMRPPALNRHVKPWFASWGGAILARASKTRSGTHWCTRSWCASSQGRSRGPSSIPYWLVGGVVFERGER